jgi:hypothetical protein
LSTTTTAAPAAAATATAALKGTAGHTKSGCYAKEKKTEVKKNQKEGKTIKRLTWFSFGFKYRSFSFYPSCPCFPPMLKACDSHHMLCCRFCMNAKASPLLHFAASFFPRQSLYVSDSKLDRSLYSSSHLWLFASSFTPLTSLVIME